ncbi:hypothetical protein Ahy_B08g091628 [Arachis hypogaea]|uniref:Uncharacterized protein n=1 Tax=Arachis hypogaea TaxID=3818 RepID=A0A444Y2K1_ARAHY|nr:hypothetical protein Ahy_B08g091628 [Arachis hypogaea]
MPPRPLSHPARSERKCEAEGGEEGDGDERALVREQRVRGGRRRNSAAATAIAVPEKGARRRERRFTDEMEREDEDAMQKKRRLFHRALSSLLGSIEAAAAARACRAFIFTFGFYDYFLSLGFHLYALSSCFSSNGLVLLEKTDSHVEPLSGAQRHPWWLKEISKVKEAISIANNAFWSIGELAVKIQKKKIKKSSDMNVDNLKAVGNGYSSSNSSSSIPYLANGGIPSLKLPVVISDDFTTLFVVANRPYSCSAQPTNAPAMQPPVAHRIQCASLSIHDRSVDI